jgi:DNA-binding NtrC family response regulator
MQALHQARLRARLAQATFPRDGVHIAALRAVLGQALAPPGNEETGAIVESNEPVMRDLYALAERAAAGDLGVLILGEPGVGKEILARRIHALSARSGKPFIRVDSLALSALALEEELFGHEPDAGTGSIRRGLLERASGGTIFLDEVGDLAPPLQARLIEAIDNREIRRSGGLMPQTLDVRFLAASHRDLEAAVKAGRFRRDLFVRLNGTSLIVPPLRERPRDIRRLAQAFVAAARTSPRDKSIALSSGALAVLCAHTWPGNVRELRNAVERALLVSPGRKIGEDHLPVALHRGETALPRLRVSRVSRTKKRRSR